MLRGRLSTVALVVTMSMILSCFGFIPDRTASTSVNIPATWNVAPSLEIDPKVTIDRDPNARTELVSEQKSLQTLTTKDSKDSKDTTRSVEQTSPANANREKRFDYTVEGTDARFSKLSEKGENAESEHVENVVPRNVVMIVAEPGEDRKDFWKNFTASHPFPVEATLQSCSNAEATRTRFSLDDALIPGNRDKNRDCEHLLRSNIVSLLFWARDVKGMTTGTLSNCTFRIPSLFGYEESVGFSKELDEIDENNMRPEVRRLKPEIRGDWHLIDLGKPVSRASSLVPVQSTREDDEAAWNVFDVFSKIRLVLFRSLLESLGGNAASEDSIQPRRSNLLDMVEELRSIGNEKGFIFVSSVSGNELDSALDLLRREVSQDTLVVVTGVCSHDAKPVPLLAQGPSAKTLREASTVWDVPNAIKNIVANGCQDDNCKSRRHDVPPPAPLKIVPRTVPVFRRSSRDTVPKSDAGKKATSAIKDEVKKVADLDTKQDDAKSVAESNAKKEEGAKNEASPKIENRNSAKSLEAERSTMLIGTFVSMIAAFTLTS
ncbi:uncharacterized protein LOC108631429 [Ceratina calcarata]|uniref:Uncharacterized protein LOC108631429 n=1 Tax=Ceratina calcarata TaxID=156304 RepID=A0AAJ7WFR9_9HYME|nr:uncharacterized protein LOC108631429 [Ceratina calcarata]